MTSFIETSYVITCKKSMKEGFRTAFSLYNRSSNFFVSIRHLEFSSFIGIMALSFVQSKINFR